MLGAGLTAPVYIRDVPVSAALTIVAALLAAGPRDAPVATVLPPRVRAESIEVRGLIDDTTARSPTVRRLLDRLGSTDTIVYVEFTSSPLIPIARTKLVTTVNGARFVRIGISTTAAPVDRGPLLGHELQHALEIAESGVHDERGLRELYTRIGRARGGDRFETETARGIEWAVREELHTKMGK